jgi:hypothetical protein
MKNKIGMKIFRLLNKPENRNIVVDICFIKYPFIFLYDFGTQKYESVAIATLNV